LLGVNLGNLGFLERPLGRPFTLSVAWTAPSPGTLASAMSLNAIGSSDPSVSTAALCSSTV
jgi:hypothetical protein